MLLAPGMLLRSATVAVHPVATAMLPPCETTEARAESLSATWEKVSVRVGRSRSCDGFGSGSVVGAVGVVEVRVSRWLVFVGLVAGVDIVLFLSDGSLLILDMSVDGDDVGVVTICKSGESLW